MISPIKRVFVNGERFATLTINRDLEGAYGKAFIRKYKDGKASVDIVLKQEYDEYMHFVLLHEIYHGMIGMDGALYARIVRKARIAGIGNGAKWYPYIMFTEELMCDAFAYHNAGGEFFITGGSRMPEFVIAIAAKIFFSKEPKVKVEIV